MKALIVDNGSVFLKELENLLQKVGVESEIIRREDFKNGQESEFNFLVLSGGHLANTNVMENLELYTEESKAIKNSPKPILGICLGHQLIATAFGGEVYRISDKVRGVFPLTEITDHPILEGVENFDVFEAHQYAVKTTNPPLISIARSENGVEILGVKERKIIGFQFHPEMSQGEKGGKQLIKNFIKIFI